MINSLLSFLFGVLSLGGVASPAIIDSVPIDKVIHYESVNGTTTYRYYGNKVIANDFKGLKEDVSKRTEYSQTFQDGENYIAKLYSGPTFYQNPKDNEWYVIETATTTNEKFQAKQPLVYRFIKTAFADTIFAGAGDGTVEKSNSDSWATTHDAATGEIASPVSTTATALTSKNLISSIFSIDRIFLPFDTSSIPGNATVLSASLNVYVTTITGLLNDDGYDYINVVQTSQPSSTTFTTADFDLVGDISNPPTGSTAKDVMTDFTSPAYNTFTLNSTGLGWVKVSGQNSTCGTSKGTTCLGLREGHDIQNVATGVGGQGITISTSEETGISQDPYLEVTYTIPQSTVILRGQLLLNSNARI